MRSRVICKDPLDFICSTCALNLGGQWLESSEPINLKAKCSNCNEENMLQSCCDWQLDEYGISVAANYTIWD